MPDQTKIREIRERLNEFTPGPQDGWAAAGLIRRFAVELQVTYSRFSLSVRNGPPDVSLIPELAAEYAAVRALHALLAAAPETAAVVAEAIAEAGEMGEYGESGSVYLGDAYPAVQALAEEMAAAMAEHKCSFQVQPPAGTIFAPGPCRCGKTWQEAQAEEAGSAPEPAAEDRPAGLARVEVKGFRDLGVVRVTETTLGGEPMVHAERTEWSSGEMEGDAAEFPASSVHFVTWLPERLVAAMRRPVLPAGSAVRPCGCGPTEECDECRSELADRLPF